MDDITVLILGKPGQAQLELLKRLDRNVRILFAKSSEDAAAQAPQADVIFAWAPKKETLQAILPHATRAKWIHGRFAGMDHVLFPELVSSPIPFTNGRGVFSQSLGEFVLASMLYFAKDFPRMRRNQKAAKWDPFDIEELSKQTMGVIAYGDIGRACAWRAKAMGMRVLALRRRPELSAGDPHVDRMYGWDGRHEMIAQSDYVVAAAPLTPETKGMVSDAEFEAMKPTAVIINVGRGPVIDEPAMIRALESGRIKGAALDVTSVEPLPADSPLYRLDNVLLSPHCADHTADWLNDAMTFFLEQFERFRTGKPLENVVDMARGY
ncbi:MAG TPA: D-2-hydroxyacid dehydrogenase [Bryobacteraceae bacterium]|jgi:phosphoglycerate dehydrogenase-like enzyme